MHDSGYMHDSGCMHDAGGIKIMSHTS